MTIVLYLILAGLMLSGIVLLKVYSRVPAVELKRRIRNGDAAAKLLFRVATYEASLQIFLWTIIGLSGAWLFVLLSRSMSPWLSGFLILVLVWLGFAWLPQTRVSFAGRKVGELAAPPLAWILNKLYPVLRFVEEKTGGYRVNVHTGVYEKEDIIELLTRQQKQKDSRIDPAELDVINGALEFGDKLVRDIMVPRRIAKIVSVDDDVGPLLLDELHKSGHSRFPVYEGKKDKIVGTLFLRDLIGETKGGKVRNFMHKQVFYVHEEETLRRALQAFFKTHRHLLIVINSFEEMSGIVTLEDIVEQIVGAPIVDEFDQYDDLRVVAAKEAATEHAAHEELEEETQSTEKPSEVVE